MMSTSLDYRTLIEARIVQETGLSVGGMVSADGDASCYRDGRGRLTIPGKSLAGLLVETAARVFPNIVASDDARRTLKRNITAKERRVPQKEEQRFRRSVWRFENAHALTDGNEPATEWRQGVGIRQATGASACEKWVLYDFEFVPAGTTWSFFLEIDTHRAGREAEAIALIALAEWVHGFGWLGRSPARGAGWFRLDPSTVRVVRVPRSMECLAAWPDNTKTRQEALQSAVDTGAVELTWDQVVEDAVSLADSRNQSEPIAWERGDWHYLSLEVSLGPETAEGGYGFDVLQVGGHPAVGLVSQQQDPLPPLSVDAAYSGSGEAKPGGNGSLHWRMVDGQCKMPDAPFVSTAPAGGKEQPYLSGGGLRGPLRHAASRIARARNCAVQDPNQEDGPLSRRLKAALRRERQSADSLADGSARALCDCVARLFGNEEICSRVLVSDAMAIDGTAILLARVDHHAEDEFTSGVFGGGKFDRNVLLRGDLAFQIVLEAPTRPELQQLMEPLLPALDLAHLGHLPIGGGKWRGAGWLKWRFGAIGLRRAGDEAGVLSGTPEMPNPPSRRLTAVFDDIASAAHRSSAPE